jgi:hypothetical protein
MRHIEKFFILVGVGVTAVTIKHAAMLLWNLNNLTDNDSMLVVRAYVSAELLANSAFIALAMMVTPVIWRACFGGHKAEKEAAQ